MTDAVLEALPRLAEPRGELMRAPDEVSTMLRLKALGWGVRRIAAELGCSHMTVRRYLETDGWLGCRTPKRAKALDGLESWLAERLRRHRGNADVVRQELAHVHGIRVSLRTVERAVQEFRRELAAEARATVRFETPPGRKLQIDFGSTFVSIADETARVFLFVATLGHSRRGFVAAFRHERQSAWLDGLERAFQHFGGIPEEVLLDNAKPLVTHHDPRTREVVFNERFHAFATGVSGRRPARRTGPGQKARTSAGSATSSAMPSPAIVSPPGPSSRHISRDGRARLPIGAFTAPPARRRSSGSTATRRVP